jgi:hypothetical protein
MAGKPPESGARRTQKPERQEKMQIQRRLLAVMITLLVGTAGCSTFKMTAVNVRTECQSSLPVTVGHVYVYQDKEDVLITGALRENGRLGHSVRQAHLHVLVLDGKRTALSQTTSDISGLPIRHDRFGGPERKSFCMRIPLLPPQDGGIQLILHEGSANQCREI